MVDRNLPNQLLEEAERLVEGMEPDLRRAVFERLRQQIRAHPLEQEWNTSADAIVEAINRSSDLTRRGIRGLLAEASFARTMLPSLERSGWKDVTPGGDIPYDVALRGAAGDIRIQIKLQRNKEMQPMMGVSAPKKMAFSSKFFVVETQKTRGGEKDGEDTRPYRFGVFDVLGVCMHPSTGQWDRFLYTVASWLIPDPGNAAHIYKFQPVPPGPNTDWTDNLETCFSWFREGEKKMIGRGP